MALGVEVTRGPNMSRLPVAGLDKAAEVAPGRPVDRMHAAYTALMPVAGCCTPIRQAKNIHGPPDARQMSSTEIGIHGPEYDRNPTAVVGSFSTSMVPTRHGSPPVELGNWPLLAK